MEKGNLYVRALLPVLLTTLIVLSGCKKEAGNDEMLLGLGLLAAARRTSDLCDNFEGILCSSFEDDTLEEWKKIGTAFDSVTVDTTDGANETNSSMKIDNSTVVGDYWGGAVGVDFANGVKPSYIGYYVKYSADNHTGISAYAATFVAHDSDDISTTNWNAYVEFQIDASNGMVYTGESNVGSIVKATWYHIELKNIDWTAKTYDLYLDGTSMATGIAMKGSGLDIGKVSFGSESKGQIVWIDEFMMY